MSVSIASDQRDSLARSLERRLPGTIAVHWAIRGQLPPAHNIVCFTTFLRWHQSERQARRLVDLQITHSDAFKLPANVRGVHHLQTRARLTGSRARNVTTRLIASRKSHHLRSREYVRYSAGMPPTPSPPSADYRPVFKHLHTSVPTTVDTPKGSAFVTGLLYRDHYIFQHPELHTSHGIRYGRFGI